MRDSNKRKLFIDDVEHEAKISHDIEDSALTVEFDNVVYEAFKGKRDADTLSLAVDGLPFSVKKEPSQPGSYTLLLNGERVQVSWTKQKADVSHISLSETVATARARQSHVRGEVRAHMSGRITEVKVRASEAVQAGDPLIILVAMKMENTLVAPLDGVVREVRVSVGDRVNKGDLLALIG